MSSVDKVAIFWSIAIVVIAVGITASYQHDAKIANDRFDEVVIAVDITKAYQHQDFESAPTQYSQESDYTTDKTDTDRILEAQALVEQAIGNYNAKGIRAFKDFNTSQTFHDKELYIFVVKASTGTIVSHGAQAQLIGIKLIDLYDADGTNLGHLFKDNVTDEGGWIKYKWPNPTNDKIEDKVSWVKSHDGYIFGTGVYLE